MEVMGTLGRQVLDGPRLGLEMLSGHVHGALLDRMTHGRGESASLTVGGFPRGGGDRLMSVLALGGRWPTG